MLPVVQPVLGTIVSDIHTTSGWVAVGILAFVGLWGVTLALLRRDPGRLFWTGVAIAVTAGILQVGMGTYLYAVEEIQPGNQHVFYGVVLMFTFAFVYMYRSQFASRPALAYGLVLLFSAGLGIRGIMTFGQSFGA